MAGKQKTLFIIDDDVTNSDLLKKYLSDKFRFNIISFTSGDEALRNINIPPDIVILDYNMNRISANALNGTEILKQVLHARPKTSVIIMGGQEKTEIASEVFRYGAYDYITKNPTGFMRIENALKHIQKAMHKKRVLRTYQELFFALLSMVIVAIVLFILLRKN
jgi:DNA-binding NtrC family response regulator